MRIWHRRLLGVLTLGGGFSGVAIGLSVLMANIHAAGTVIVLVPFIALYAWGVWCGLKLIEGAPDALRPNRIYWALQVPYFSSPVVSFMFAGGSLFYLNYQPGSSAGFLFRIMIGGQFNFTLFNASMPLAFGVNIIALAVSIYLTRLLRAERARPAPIDMLADSA